MLIHPHNFVTSDLALPQPKTHSNAQRKLNDVDLIILGTTSPYYIKRHRGGSAVLRDTGVFRPNGMSNQQ